MNDALRNFDHKLFFTLVCLALLPTLYATVRIHFLGNLPDDYGFNIASQIAWVNVMYEVVQEGLILPLFYFIGQSLKDDRELENRVRTGLVTSFAIYAFFSLFLILFVKDILIFMEQKPELIGKSVDYIRLETVAVLFSILYRFVNLVLVATKNVKSLLAILLFQMAATVVSDTLLVSDLDFSLKAGVNGIAIGNIVVNLLLFAMGAIALRKQGIAVFGRGRLSFEWQREWWRIGRMSGLESLIRNAAFILIILKMINSVREQGTFWVANHFIWGWLLLPVLALGELIKRNSGEHPGRVTRQFPSYLWAVTLIMVFWLVTSPLWGYFLEKAMNVGDGEKTLRVVAISIFFYVIFAYNTVVDSVFYGIGRTDLMLWQSVIVNALFYGGAFVLFQTNLFVPTLDKIAVMFGTGIAFDAVITFAMYFYLVKKNRLIARPLPN